MARLLKGAPVTRRLIESLVRRAAALRDGGIDPTLAIVRVGAREDDLGYERALAKRCDAVGIGMHAEVLPADCSQAALKETIAHINGDAGVHGCLLMRPLPPQLDERAATGLIAPGKDADGATDASLAAVLTGTGVGHAPCTADAVMELLRFYDVPLDGVRACVVGRSLVVGRPVALLLQAANATVTLCHSHTRDLATECHRADVVVVATGRPATLVAACARPGQTVVDVGIHWDERRQRLVGDVDFDAVEPIVGAITPVPGGVGSLTTAILARHVIDAAERAAGGAMGA